LAISTTPLFAPLSKVKDGVKHFLGINALAYFAVHWMEIKFFEHCQNIHPLSVTTIDFVLNRIKEIQPTRGQSYKFFNIRNLLILAKR
jgi:hypothetical protein